MLTWSDVEGIAEQIPGLEYVPGPPRSWNAPHKTAAWERPLSKKDLAALGDRAPRGAVLAIHTADVTEKLAWIETAPATCFDSPHFAGYPAVLVNLDTADAQVVFELLSLASELPAKSR
ncbi:MAG: hypothetical protein RL672_622 [Actinomycetota bacterium]|jgi:hypothetical protein